MQFTNLARKFSRLPKIVPLSRVLHEEAEKVRKRRAAEIVETESFDAYSEFFHQINEAAKLSFNRVSYKRIMKRKMSEVDSVPKLKLKRTKIPDTCNTCEESEESEKKEETPVESPLSAPPLSSTIANDFLQIQQNLSTKLQDFKFQSPVAYVYNPLEYAFEVHSMYVRKYCNSTKRILFLGMNPGPFGMVQTGVPFGEINMVRNWLKIYGQVGKPPREHVDRKVTGFDCTRSEVSGKRLWGLFKEICRTPENLFRHAYVHNYCPIALMNQKGGNITPAELKHQKEEIKRMHSVCDSALADVLKLLEVEIVVGIGKYAEERARISVTLLESPIRVLSIPHPSPRAVGNQKWDEKARKILEELKLLEYLKA